MCPEPYDRACVRSVDALRDEARVEIPNDDCACFCCADDFGRCGERERRGAAVARGRLWRRRASRGIRFELARFLVVPEPHVLVEVVREDVFSVRREPRVAHGRVVVVHERLDALTRGDVPDAAEPVERAGEQKGAVAGERDRDHRVRVRRQGGHRSPCADIPELHGLVERAACNERRCGVELARHNPVAVPRKGLEQLARRRLPESQRPVVRRSHEVLGVRRPRNVRDPHAVPLDHSLEPTCLCVPDAKRFVGRHRGDEKPIVGELCCRDAPCVPYKSVFENKVAFGRIRRGLGTRAGGVHGRRRHR
eukprot:Amastigsp_a3627_17.p2 type:complete len:308 gc:universal Amastigsp_a3627_17:133-1056(+)